jgi:hypothetical protein
MKIINARYVSVWDNGTEIKTPCTFDVVDNVVEDVDKSLHTIRDEYVLLPDGTIIRDFTLEDEN